MLLPSHRSSVAQHLELRLRFGPGQPGLAQSFAPGVGQRTLQWNFSGCLLGVKTTDFGCNCAKVSVALASSGQAFVCSEWVEFWREVQALNI